MNKNNLPYKYFLFVRKTKTGKVLTHPVFNDAQDMANQINQYLDVSPRDIKVLMKTGYVKCLTQFGYYHLTVKFS
jgi:hypothetical protein